MKSEKTENKEINNKLNNKMTMKKIAIALVAIVSLLTSGSLRAAESGTCGDNITWTLNDAGNLVLAGHGAMRDYDSDAPWSDYADDIKTITISDGITSIGDDAFYNCSNLRRVSIPSGVTRIGYFAFNCCGSLESVTIPNSVAEIADGAFAECGLKNVVIPDGVTRVGIESFVNCLKLERLTISSSVAEIGQGAFLGCRKLESIVVDNANPTYDSRNNCNAIIETQTNAMLFGCKNTVIPKSVVSVDGFDGSGVTNIVIPNGVTSIDSYAFCDCRDLVSVAIGATVKTIGRNAFRYCPKLESIVVDEGNPTYDSRNNCNAIIETQTNKLLVGCKNTVIPSRVTSIESGAFDGSGVTNVVIPNGVTSIPDHAFYDCADLESVTIGANVEAIGRSAFYECPNLQNVVVSKANLTYDSRNDCNAIIETKTNTLVLGCKGTVIPGSVVSIGDDAFEGSGLTSIVIPDGVTAIRDYAFLDCTELESVTLGRNVEFVGLRSFFNCDKLKRFELLATVPPMVKNFNFDWGDETVFSDDAYYTCQLVVPDEAIDAYLRTAPWAYFDHVAGVEDVIADGGVAVTAEGNNIIVNGADNDADVEVYGVGGALVYRGASHSIAVPAAGIYVVRVAGKAVKVVVK